MAWVPLAIEVRRLAGDLDGAEAMGHETVAATTATDGAYASTRAAQLAHLLIQRGDFEAADRYATLSEQTALDADVYVQFLWRGARARLLARAGQLAEAEAIGADAVAIASLTDALCDRARTHFALADVLSLAGKQAAAKQQLSAGRRLLRRKGATALLAESGTKARGALASSSRATS